MKKGNAAVFLLIVSVLSVAVTSYLAQQEIRVRRAGAAGGAAPVGQILAMPSTARAGETIDISAQISDSDQDLADPLSTFSNVIKLYVSRTVGPTNPSEWTEIPSSQASYQCYNDGHTDHCKMFAHWTPPAAGKYTFIVNGMDKAGNKCSGNPYFNYADQTEWTRCGLNNEDWREITITTTPPVAGHIRDLDGKGIANVSVGVYPQGVKEYVIKTDANGYFSLDTTDLPAGRLYLVRTQSEAPAGHKNPPKTTNITRSMNTTSSSHTPFGNIAYENQKVGQSDCGKIDASGAGCDFEYEKFPTPSNTPTPTNTPTPSPTKTPTPTPTMTLTPTSTPSPTLTQTPTPSPTLTLSPTLSPTPSVVVSISPTITGCQKRNGDANCNGIITIADYAIWRQEYLGGCTTQNYTFKACGEDRDGDNRPIDADFSGDNRVSLIDFTIWKANFR